MCVFSRLIYCTINSLLLNLLEMSMLILPLNSFILFQVSCNGDSHSSHMN